jgi:hypothetical protein
MRISTVRPLPERMSLPTSSADFPLVSLGVDVLWFRHHLSFSGEVGVSNGARFAAFSNFVSLYSGRTHMGIQNFFHQSAISVSERLRASHAECVLVRSPLAFSTPIVL